MNQPKDQNGFPSLVQSSLVSIDQLSIDLQKIEETLSLYQTPRKKVRLNEGDDYSLQLLQAAKEGIVNTKKKRLFFFLAIILIFLVLEFQSCSQKLLTKSQRKTASSNKRSLRVKEEESSWSETSPQTSSRAKVSKKQKSKKYNGRSSGKSHSKSRGDYVTVSPQIRSKLYQILREQVPKYFNTQIVNMH